MPETRPAERSGVGFLAVELAGKLGLLVGRDQRAEPLDAPGELGRAGAAQLDGPGRVEHQVGQAALGVGLGHLAQGRRGGQARARACSARRPGPARPRPGRRSNGLLGCAAIRARSAAASRA